MKIRALANGEVIDFSEDGARILIGAGIYEAVDERPGGTPTSIYDGANANELPPLPKRKGRKPQK